MDFLNNIVSFVQEINLQDVWDFISNPPKGGIYLYLQIIFIIVFNF